MKDSQHSSQQGPQSSLLKERLQRERRSEIQRGLDRLAGDMSTVAEPKVAATTPTRFQAADGIGNEPKQETNCDGKKGPALNDEDQVCLLSSLDPL